MNLKLIFSLAAVGLLFTAFPCTEGAKILAVYAFPGKSHYSMTNSLIKELIRHGHEVTMITARTLAPLKLGSNFTEILIDPPYDFWRDVQAKFGSNNLFEMTSMTVFEFMGMFDIISSTTTEYALQHPQVQDIINAKKTEGVYDLLLVEQFYQEPFLALSRIYNIPVVSMCTLGYLNYMGQMTGMIVPLSYVPQGYMPFTDRMSFLERARNVFFTLYEDLYREFIYFPNMDKLMQKYFSHLPIEIPSITKMEKNISAILLNSYAPLTTARPTAPSMIFVGGMHIYPPKKLPNEFQKFLDEASHGVIFFSLGSNVQSKDMPADKLKLFLKVFAGLKQRVLWKFENESIADLPPNVMVKSWLPQADILAHPNVKVFITHGGLFGTQEGVYHAVPLLGMPFYCDQHLNMKKAVQGGYGINLLFQSITEDILRNSILELIENPMYKKNIQEMSDIFRDRPLNARDTAMFWIDHVIRHKGAPHLRTAGLDLAWYQFYLLDILAAIIGVILGIIFLVKFLLRRLLVPKGNAKRKVKKN